MLRNNKITEDKIRLTKKFILEGTIAKHIKGYDTHMYEKHCDMSDVESLDRILNKDPRKRVLSQGVFIDNINDKAQTKEDFQEYADNLVSEAMMYYIDDILKWLDKDIVYDGEKFDRPAPMAEGGYFGYIGNVMKKNPNSNLIREYKANSLRFVLVRDKDEPLGFYLKTAFPEVCRDFSKPERTTRNLQALIVKTEAYKNASPKEKTALLFQTSPNNRIPVKYFTSKDGREFLCADIPIRKKTEAIYRIYFEEDKTEIVKQENSRSHAKWLESDFSEVYKADTKYEDTVFADLANSAVMDLFRKRTSQEIQQTVRDIAETLGSFSREKELVLDFEKDEEEYEID